MNFKSYCTHVIVLNNDSSCNNNYNVFVYEPSARVILANRAIFGVVYMYFVVHNLSRDPPLTRPVEGLAEAWIRRQYDTLRILYTLLTNVAHKLQSLSIHVDFFLTHQELDANIICSSTYQYHKLRSLPCVIFLSHKRNLYPLLSLYHVATQRLYGQWSGGMSYPSFHLSWWPVSCLKA